MSKSCASAPLAVGVLVILLGTIATAQPPHPRLLVDSSDLAWVQARVNQSGHPAATAYAQLATSAPWSASASQGSWTTYSNLRRMQEVAFRYWITGYASYGNSARNALLAATQSLTPTGATSYLYATYPAAIAITYDLVHDVLTPSQRTQVVQHLEAWISALETGNSGGASYSGYAACADNWAFSWSLGITMAALAIWGESNRPDLQGRASQELDRIAAGWNDSISPDGSVDESYGYMNYGALSCIWASLAGERCGLPDRIAGTNLERVPRWLVSSLFPEGNGWSTFWIGDSSPSHKGMRWDPVLLHLIGRTQDAEAFWMLQQVYAQEPIGNGSVTWALSPRLGQILHWPDLTSQVPQERSGFFRDNLNRAPAQSNKTHCYSEVGEGGIAHLRAGRPGTADVPFALTYQIKDEWHTHGHEDDGQVLIAAGGQRHYVDPGYAGNSSQGFVRAQNTDHNTVTVVGASTFGGSNLFSPPGNEGRFYGRQVAQLEGEGLDYLHGDHAHMWGGLAHGTRSVVLVGDPAAPYAIVLDRMRRQTSGSTTFDQKWNSSGPWSGSGTLADPARVNRSGVVLRSSWIEPANPTLIPGSQSSGSGGITYWPNRVRVSGTGTVTNLSVHHLTPLSAHAPLVAPTSNTRGAVLDFGATQDRILARVDAGTLSTARTESDASMVWLRESQGSLSAGAMLEGTYLLHDAVPLVTSSAVIALSWNQGIVDLARLAGDPDRALLPTVTLRGLGTVTEVRFDGQSVPFAIQGNEIVVGTPPPPPLIKSDDRFYTFSEGTALDAALGGGAAILPDGTVGAAGPDAWIAPLQDQPWTSEALYLAADVHIGADANGPLAELVFGSAPGQDDFLRVEAAWQPAAGLSVRIEGPLASPQVVALGTLAWTTMPPRLAVEYRPGSGEAILRDRWGRQLASVVVRAQSAPVHARVNVLPGAFVDSVALYDSAEDGATPQGVASWVLPSGRLGLAVQAPIVNYGPGLEFAVNGFSLGATASYATLAAYSFGEVLPVGAAGLTWLPELRELAVESTIPLFPIGSGVRVTVGYQTLFGVSLASEVEY